MTGGRIRRRPDVLWRRSLDAVVLLAEGGGEVVTLAGTGPAVWELLAEWRTYDDVVENLAQAFGEDPAVVDGDLQPLMAELERFGLLQMAVDSGGAGAE